MLDIN